MHQAIIAAVVGLLGLSSCSGQPTPNQQLNLSFEKTSDKGNLIGCSFSWDQDDYFSYKDDSVKMDGRHSLRLQKDPKSDKGGYGVITFSLPANFKGTAVTLKGYIKTDGVRDGYAGLWLRSDAGRQAVGFENMSDSGVIGTKDWKQYSVTVPMDDNVTSIAFGGLLVGKGISWFDKLELLVDNKPIESVTWMPDKIRPMRKELMFSGVAVDSLLSNQQKENLYVLGKVWGYLKYHHPEVAKGDYDFDSCLFSILPAVLQAKDKGQRDAILLNWINTLGNENNNAIASLRDTFNIHTKPNLAWINDKQVFTEALSARLGNIYAHRNSGSNFYVRLMPEVGNPVFDKEATYKFIPASDDGFRLLALFRYWNMIEYFYPYKYLLKENWNDVLKNFIPVFAAQRSALDYRLACLQLINHVHDTHANIYGDATLSKYFGNKTPAIYCKSLLGKIIVTGYLSDSLAEFGTLKPGDEIITVNGKDIADLKRLVEPYLCASNSSVADRNFIDRFLFKSNDDSLWVTYKRNGKLNKTALRLYAAGKVPYRNGDNWKRPMYQLLSSDIGYVSLGKIRSDSLPVIFKTFENTKGIIIDIRNYPSQFMPFALADYLKSSSTSFVKFTVGDVGNPGSFNFTPSLNNGPEKNTRLKPYKGAVVILVNEQSQSQAEYTTMALRTAIRSVVMGSQTAGADGNISYVPFPGGFSSPFSGIGVFYPDGTGTQGIGIVPDIIVVPTQKGISEGKDEVLDQAIDYIRKAKGF